MTVELGRQAAQVDAYAAAGRRRAEASVTTATERPTPSAPARRAIDLRARGCSNVEIAERFYVAEKTVKNRPNRIFAELHAANRAEAMAIWRGEGGPS